MFTLNLGRQKRREVRGSEDPGEALLHEVTVNDVIRTFVALEENVVLTAVAQVPLLLLL